MEDSYLQCDTHNKWGTKKGAGRSIMYGASIRSAVTHIATGGSWQTTPQGRSCGPDFTYAAWIQMAECKIKYHHSLVQCTCEDIANTRASSYTWRKDHSLSLSTEMTQEIYHFEMIGNQDKRVSHMRAMSFQPWLCTFKGSRPLQIRAQDVLCTLKISCRWMKT